jgi:hypothetical protein
MMIVVGKRIGIFRGLAEKIHKKDGTSRHANLIWKEIYGERTALTRRVGRGEYLKQPIYCIDKGKKAKNTKRRCLIML